MYAKAAVLAFVAAVAFGVFAGSSADAKGGYKVVEARLFGGRLAGSLTVTIALPEGYDEMYERQPPVIESMSIYQSGGYHLELRFDFQESGHGQGTWLGFYDGGEVLFFSRDMRVGNATWSAGWYTASPLLAAALQSGLAPAPPTTGTGTRSQAPDGATLLWAGLFLTGLGATAGALSWRYGSGGHRSCEGVQRKA